MTVREKIISLMVNKGMFESQAAQVLELAKPDIEVGGYRMSWDRPADEYPDALYTVIGLTLNPHALAWIDEHCPEAWFRPMFCDDPESELARLINESASTERGSETR